MQIMAYQESRFVSAKETAVIIRGVLKESFPGTRFSVRIQRHANGSHIFVRWIDGPQEADVNASVRHYRGYKFDGMIDLRYPVEHWLLPDGSAIVRHDHGFVKSGGDDAEVDNRHPASPLPVGTEVEHFVVDRVFAWRETGPDQMRQA